MDVLVPELGQIETRQLGTGDHSDHLEDSLGLVLAAKQLAPCFFLDVPGEWPVENQTVLDEAVVVLDV